MSANTQPSICVTRRLPEPVESELTARFQATLNSSDQPMSRDALAVAMRQFDILLPTITDRIDADLLNMPDRQVRMIANYGAGVDHIDIAAAQAAGVVVTNTPDALTEATAELAILLMLMAARRAGEGERELRAGQWSGWRPTHLVGMGLNGRTLGLVGFGRIAQATAEIAKGLGMTIRYFSRTGAAPSVVEKLGAQRDASLVDLARVSDVLSLHVPGGERTRHLIDREILTSMKPGAILVNTARGTIIDEQALVDALEANKLGAAALDVYEREPAVHPGLLQNTASVFLPHLGSATTETRTAMGRQALQNIDAFLAGDVPPNKVA